MSFDPNSAWGSIGTMTIGKTHPSLHSMIWRPLYHYLMFASAEHNLLAAAAAMIVTMFDTFLVNVVIADASGSQEYVLMLVRYHIKE